MKAQKFNLFKNVTYLATTTKYTQIQIVKCYHNLFHQQKSQATSKGQLGFLCKDSQHFPNPLQDGLCVILIFSNISI